MFLSNILRILGYVKIYWRLIVIIGLPLALLPLVVGGSKVSYGAYSVILMAIFWMLEVVPTPITALMPIFLFPLFGIESTEKIVSQYFKDSLVFFVGGLIVALSFEASGIHVRIALRVMLLIGAGIRKLLCGIMINVMILSCWMSNTATTAMMVPIISAILEELQKSIEIEQKSRNDDKQQGNDKKSSEDLDEKIRKMRTMFLLGTCYSANIGGTGVLSGSGTNLIAYEFLGDLDPKVHGNYASLTFASWMMFNTVPMLINVAIAWIYLQIIFIGIPKGWKFWQKGSNSGTTSQEIFSPEAEKKIESVIRQKFQDLGVITPHEIGVLCLFIFVALSWIFHDPKFVPGWREIFTQSNVSISTSTLGVVILYFIIPSNPEFYNALKTRDFSRVKKIKPLLEWDYVQAKLPWGVVLLMGGGYALSAGAKKSGLSTLIGGALGALGGLPPPAIQITCMILIGFATEVASNTAIASLCIPILYELSKELNIHPLYLTLPSTVTCSYAFMLPVATPPNAIAYAASGDMKVFDMIKSGFLMNCICIGVLFAFANTAGNFIFHFNEYQYNPSGNVTIIV